MDPAPAASGAAPSGLYLRVELDLNTLGFGAGVSVQMGLRDLLAVLPPDAQAVLGWVPDIMLEDAAIRFDPGPPGRAFALYAAAGTVGSADRSAGVYLFTITTPGQQPLPPSTTTAVGVDLRSSIDLGATPLFGSMLSGIALDRFGLVYASADVPAGSIRLPGVDPPPLPALTTGLTLAFTLAAGGSTETFRLTPSSFKKPPAIAARNPASEVASPEQRSAPVQWFNLDRTFGPITIGRIGVLTEDNRFGLALDASIALTSFQLELVGFTLSFATDDISVGGARIDLDGLRIGMSAGSFRMAGSLVRARTAEPVEYRGSVLIEIGQFGIAAVGAYANLNGRPSLFVFGLVTGAFGGPPAFFVTGLAAGVGYQRSLRLPAPDQVQDFPMIRAAREGTGYMPDPSPGTALSKLADGGWVAPEAGSYWVVAGVRFRSFELIDSFVLVTVQFGNDLVLALLGIASLQLPKPTFGRPFAYVELSLSTVIRPRTGSFEAIALLTPNSYILDPSCKLTGGFAASAWFGPNPHAGDFVVTIGGYHPLFIPPEWYPNVPRVGISWQVSSQIQISGGAYFALTPSCVMGGGALSLKFQAGALRAWFDAYADFLMFWRPFFFDVRIGVSIGASYTMRIAGLRKTFTVELSAAVELWGPPVKGKARVSWWVISFTIAINGGGEPELPPKVVDSWKTFADTFLPPPPPTEALRANGDSLPVASVCRPRAVAGLIRSIADGTVERWIVAPSSFILGVESVIPATLAEAGDGDRRFTITGPPASVYPMGSVPMDSTLSVRITPDLTRTTAQLASAPTLADWSWTPNTTNAPGSLWDDDNTGTAKLGATVVPALVGLQGTPPPPTLNGPPPVPLSRLSVHDLTPRPLALSNEAAVDHSTTAPTTSPRLVVAETIASAPVVARRDQIVGQVCALGIGQHLDGGDLSGVVGDIWNAFPYPPMLGPVASTGPAVTFDHGQPISARQRRDRHRAPTRPTQPLLIWRPATTRSGSGVLHHLGSHEPQQPIDRAITSAVLPAGRCGAMVLTGHLHTVWSLDTSKEHMLVGDGAAPVWVAAIGRGHMPLLVQTLPAAEFALALPAGTRRLVVAAAEATADTLGWRHTDHLLAADAFVLVGGGLVTRTQGPVQLRGRSCGVTTAARALAANTTESDAGIASGAIEITVPGDHTHVALDLLPTADRRVAGPDETIIAVSEGHRLELLDTEFEQIVSNGARRTVRLDSRIDSSHQLRVHPAPGWRVDAVRAAPSADALADWHEGRPSAQMSRLHTAATTVILR